MASVEPVEPCPHCRGTGWVLVSEGGVEAVRRCACAEVKRRAKLLERAGIPDRYLGCTLSGFETWAAPGQEPDPTLPRARRVVQEFVDLYPNNPKPGLLLMGGVGCGKTHLAAAALSSLVRDKGAQGLFVDFTALLLQLQHTFGASGEAQQVLLDPLGRVELLVLDELGAGRASPWVMDLLYFVVNTRYVAGRATIFTTNYTDPTDTPRPDLESLADRVSRRIRSRLFEMCQKVELRCGDYRKHRFSHPQYEKNA